MAVRAALWREDLHRDHFQPVTVRKKNAFYVFIIDKNTRRWNLDQYMDR